MRRSVISWPVVSFSSSRTTPPFRLTSSVSATCFVAAPPLVVHEASTGMRKLTRSLCRSPSLLIVSLTMGNGVQFRLASPGLVTLPASFSLSYQLISLPHPVAVSRRRSLLILSPSCPMQFQYFAPLSGTLVPERGALYLQVRTRFSPSNSQWATLSP